jgi:hypothetical protein
MRKTKPHVDVQVTGEGTIFLFDLRTEKAREWVAEHIVGETTYFAGMLTVEHRYAHDLAGGMVADGLELQ